METIGSEVLRVFLAIVPAAAIFLGSLWLIENVPRRSAWFRLLRRWKNRWRRQRAGWRSVGQRVDLGTLPGRERNRVRRPQPEPEWIR